MNYFVVKSDSTKYIYDIHSLVSAFYPGWEIHVITPESVVRDRNLKAAQPQIMLSFGEKEISCTIQGKTFTCQREQEPAAEKNELKKFLYQSLQQATGQSLPWGNLTGIRPTKIAMTMLEEGKSEEEIRTFLRTEHFVSEEKIRLGIDIAEREKALLETLHYEDGYSIYIGIPFCPTTCLYCSFTSYPICSWKNRVGEYLGALGREIAFLADFYRDKKLDTIYIGGGTPTTLEADQLQWLMDQLHSSFDFTYVKEFTVEAGRADSITRAKLEVLYQNGVTRISVNPQTMKQETLKLIGRQHTVEQTVQAFQLAREVGFTNINMDIILGLPGETQEDVAETIRRITELSPDSLTVHSLAIKKASRMQQWIEENGISALQNTEECMEIASAGARQLQMKPYYLYRQKHMSGNFENVGYARDGKFGLYNVLIMEEKQTIVALGAGSITKRVYSDGRIERSENARDLDTYLTNIEEMIRRKQELLA